jgi:NADH-quinone oxidoreductase subunit C
VTETPTPAAPAPRWDSALSGLTHVLVPAADGVGVEVAVDALHEALRRLRDDAGFETCTFVTAVDHHPREPRFQLDHQLLSIGHGDRVRVRTWLRGDFPSAPTCSDLWPGADWMERECFDLFGIRFEGHRDLRRLLMPAGYEHHPLRKEFPHHGIEPDRLYRKWDRERRQADAAAFEARGPFDGGEAR